MPSASPSGTLDPWRAALAAAIMRSVFISEDVTVALPFSQASQAAYDDGVTALIRVGPWHTAPLTAKLVRVRFLEPHYTAESVRIGLRWEATGPAAGLFPALDADITLADSGEQDCRLALSGTYRPPLGRLGDELDRAMLGRVAAATIRALLGNVSAALAHPELESQAGNITDLTTRPAAEPGT